MTFSVFFSSLFMFASGNSFPHEPDILLSHCGVKSNYFMYFSTQKTVKFCITSRIQMYSTAVRNTDNGYENQLFQELIRIKL